MLKLPKTLMKQKKFMRLPKQVQISGMTYPIRTDKTSYDGGGSTASLGIMVGTKSDNEVRI